MKQTYKPTDIITGMIALENIKRKIDKGMSQEELKKKVNEIYPPEIWEEKQKKINEELTAAIKDLL